MPPKRKGRSQEYIDDSDDPEDTGAKTKKAKIKVAASSAAEGEGMIPLSAKRFVNVRTFNGKVLVDIREYYTDDSGERKPGKKGISLSKDQWETLKDAIPDIDSRISEL